MISVIAIWVYEESITSVAEDLGTSPLTLLEEPVAGVSPADEVGSGFVPPSEDEETVGSTGSGSVDESLEQEVARTIAVTAEPAIRIFLISIEVSSQNFLLF
jgi:hypothetical protein